MNRRITLPGDRDAFQELFTGLSESWFRLETLQDYSAGDTAPQQEFLAGRPRRPVPSSWETMIRDHVAAGRTLQRVHVVREPLTDYVRWELHAYQATVEAGEDVRVIPVPDGGSWPPGVPEGYDFWLFDDRDVWSMDYDDTGRLLACELNTDPHAVERHRSWRDAALRASVPLRDYQPAEHALRRAS